MGFGGGSSLLWGRRADILNYGVWERLASRLMWGRRTDVINHGVWGGSRPIVRNRRDVPNYKVWGR